MKRILKRGALALFGLLLVVVAAAFVAGSGVLGPAEGPGQVTKVQRPVPTAGGEQILFGDFHVHTTLSADAFLMSLPILGGEGTHPQADACDFARFCSALDFWSINDHAEALTQSRWQDTVSSIKACNAVADPSNPDTVAFLGWEWTQMGDRPTNHYGHRNVILKSLKDVPARPIAARAPETLPDDFGLLTLPQRAALALAQPNMRSVEAGSYYRETEKGMAKPCPDGVPVRDLPADCMESAATPADLLRKLEDWGQPMLLIPHGTTWGNYTPPGSDWRKQLTPAMHNPKIQTMVEVYSGHGSGEEYRSWRGVKFDEAGNASCPAPSEGYLPSCWRAGEIIRARCLAEGADAGACEARAVLARQAHAERGAAGQLVVPGAGVEEWLNAGQCQDCFLPAFNYRPMGSAQYMLAITEESGLRFRFGFIGSSDNHAARPGTGFKELNRREMTEATGLRKGLGTLGRRGEKLAEPDLVDLASYGIADRAERARISSFFTTGGLVAVHAKGRARDQIWDALEMRHVYGTSGDRILLWFDMLDPAGRLPMGSAGEFMGTPEFEVRAVGAFKQKPGCPDVSAQALGAERLYALCRNECYNPSDERKMITRIEIVKITPQLGPDEALDGLIEDPWRVFDCQPNEEGCAVRFTDPDYEQAGRDAVYYARAVQEPTPAINGANLRCTYDAEGNCVAVSPCHADEDGTDYEDDCLAPVEERAWSSPIFLDVPTYPID